MCQSIGMAFWVWLGTLAFAAGGALEGARRRFDLVGVLLVASVTAVGGGSVRDLVVGRLPPRALLDEGMLWFVALTGVVVFFLPRTLGTFERFLYYIDTLGLGVFAALGAAEGLSAGLGFWGTVFAGTVSGIGGGVLCDLLTGRVPGVFYRAGDFYASAAAAGSAVLYLAGSEAAVPLAAAITVLVRMSSRAFGLRLPRAQ